MAAPTKSTLATKTEFSGPADLIALAHRAADPAGTFEGDRWVIGARGAWSEWLCSAIKEKLVRDGHWPTEQNALRAELLEAADEIGLGAALEALRRELRARSTPAVKPAA